MLQSRRVLYFSGRGRVGSELMALIDFLIITPLDEEWRSVQRILCPRPIEKSIGPVTYYLCSQGLQDDRGDYLIAAASMGKMGQTAAGIFTSKALDSWRPAHVVLLGIAGSLRGKKIPLGDVVVSTEFFGYDLGDVVGRPPRFRFRRTGHQVGAVLLARARALRNDPHAYESWQTLCLRAASRERSFKLPKRRPEIHFGITASGNLVVKSKAFMKELREQVDERVCAVEMEAKGLCDAVHVTAPATEVLLIRGASDYSTASKSDLEQKSKNAWRRYAAGNAARLLALLLLRRPLEPVSRPFDLNMQQGPLTDLGDQVDFLPGSPGEQTLLFTHLLGRAGPTPGFALEVRAFHSSHAPLEPEKARCLIHTQSSMTAVDPQPTSQNSVVFSVPRTEESMEVKLFLRFKTNVNQLQVVCSDEFGRQTKKVWP